MPRYFFHLRKNGRAPDLAGVDLSGPGEARIQATRCMAEEMKDHPSELWDDREWLVDVADESGLVLFSVVSTAFEATSRLGPSASRPSSSREI